MNILINAVSARIGGGQTYLLNLLNTLPKNDDFKIYIYTLETLLLPDNERIIKLTTKYPTDNPLLRVFWEKLVLPKILRKLNIDVLFCPGGLISTHPPKTCKTVTMFRNMLPFDMRMRRRIPYGLQRVRNWILARLMLKSMAKADLVIFISNFARQVIEEKITIKRAVTIPHGLSSHFRQDAHLLERPDIVPKNDYILYVSRFDFYKHHFEVVTAYSKLSINLRNQFSLVLAGETNSSEYTRVKQLITELGLDEYVYIIGAVSYQNLPAVYKFAYANIFASSCENCPNILLEAMGAGRPVLSSDIMPMPEFGGSAVIYFSPFDSEDLAEKLAMVLSDETMAVDLSHLATQQSRQFDWQITADKTWLEILSLKPSVELEEFENDLVNLDKQKCV